MHGLHVRSAQVQDRHVFGTQEDAVPPHQALYLLVLPKMLWQFNDRCRRLIRAGPIAIVDNLPSPGTKIQVRHPDTPFSMSEVVPISSLLVRISTREYARRNVPIGCILLVKWLA
jgi:hypothetical protein